MALRKAAIDVSQVDEPNGERPLTAEEWALVAKFDAVRESYVAARDNLAGLPDDSDAIARFQEAGRLLIDTLSGGLSMYARNPPPTPEQEKRELEEAHAEELRKKLL